MEISHVIRGVGHLSNTPKQVLLYRAFGVTPPEFVHIPTVLAPGGGKLSKRRGAAASVLDYRDRGFHPDAVLELPLPAFVVVGGRGGVPQPGGAHRSASASIAWVRRIRRWMRRRWHGSRDGTCGRNRRKGWLGDWAGRPRCVEGLGLDPADLEPRGRSLRQADTSRRRRTRPRNSSRSYRASLTPAEPSAREALSAPAKRRPRSVWPRAAWARDGVAPRASRRRRFAPRCANRRVRGGRTFFPPGAGRPDRAASHGPDLGEVAYALGRERALARLAAAMSVASSDGDDPADDHTT